MSYVTIAAQLVSLLSTINVSLSSGSEPLQVYSYEAKELKKYPCVTVTALSHKDLQFDTAANRRQYTFMVRAYYRTDNASDAESIMRALVDSIISTIEANVSLNGSCDFAKATEAKWGFQDRELPVRVCEVTIEAVKRVNR